jgi:hypothetical protein
MGDSRLNSGHEVGPDIDRVSQIIALHDRSRNSGPNNKGTPMSAIVCTKYGPPEVLQLREVENPTPGKNEVRIIPIRLDEVV